MAGRALTYFRGEWLEGNPGIFGPLTHAVWLSSFVFDGARAFEGVAPDLDRHCERVVHSAEVLGIDPVLTAGEIEELAREGLRRFPRDAELYIRPMIYAEGGFVDPDPATSQVALTLHEMPMPSATGFGACLSDKRRPMPDTAPTGAKAACHYPNAGIALRQAKKRGFQNAILCDPLGHVAEFATANLFLAKDGVVATPIPNGTFLNGITRQRVIALLRHVGVPVVECSLSVGDVLAADEVFSTGNYGKVVPVTRIEDRALQPGPFARQARRLYWEFAHS